ncbi:MAG TPA: glycosyltransferase family A protein [Candidatus Binataceae bacterium]|nr:glycosyltransferase family A protein [Candidatus Binataceae bacterium]
MTKYIAITPARDEEAFIPGLITSMTSQKTLPERWIIIDDGSSDLTGAIIDEAAARYPFIEPKHLPRDREREPGGESVIMRFLDSNVWGDAEFLVRFDADMLFGPNYLQLLFDEFACDPKLGIASGELLEPEGGGEWAAARAPEFHTRGPSKVYSRACFDAIGGLESGLGWDTIDEVRAMMAGYRTRSFRHIQAYHRRTTNSARGLWRGRLAVGEAAWQSGYSPLFMIARAVGNSLEQPFPICGLLMLAGYFLAALKRKPVLVDQKIVRFVRDQQWRRLTMRESVWR